MRRQKITDLTEWFSRYKPHDKQKIFHALADEKYVTLACAGVRGGKTKSAPFQCGRYIYMQRLEPNLAWLVVPSYKTGQQAAKDLLEFFDPMIIKRTGSPGKPMTIQLMPPAGYKYPFFEIDVRSAENPNLLRGAKLAFAWMDEGRDCGEDTFNIVRQRLIDTHGKMIITTTPKGRSHWLYERVYKKAAIDKHPEYGFVQWSTYENPYLDKSVILELERDFPKEFGRQELYGEFVNLSGLVYPEFSRDKNAIPKFDLPNAMAARERGEAIPRFFMGVDFGYEDLFICLWIMDWRGKYWVVDEYAMPRKITRDHARMIASHPVTPFCEALYCDPNNITLRMELMAALQDLNCKVKTFPAPRDGSGKNKDFDKGIRLIRRLIVDEQLYVFSDCVNLLREFGLYHYKEATEDKNSGDKPVDKFNHSLDALRYGLRAWTSYRPAMATLPRTRDELWTKPEADEFKQAYEAKKQIFEPWYLEGED